MPRVLVGGGLSEQIISAYTYTPIPIFFALLLPLIAQNPYMLLTASTFTIPYMIAHTAHTCAHVPHKPNLYLVCF